MSDADALPVSSYRDQLAKVALASAVGAGILALLGLVYAGNVLLGNAIGALGAWYFAKDLKEAQP